MIYFLIEGSKYCILTYNSNTKIPLHPIFGEHAGVVKWTFLVVIRGKLMVHRCIPQIEDLSDPEFQITHCGFSRHLQPKVQVQ